MVNKISGLISLYYQPVELFWTNVCAVKVVIHDIIIIYYYYLLLLLLFIIIVVVY